jgi:hypothetical protein
MSLVMISFEKCIHFFILLSLNKHHSLIIVFDTRCRSALANWHSPMTDKSYSCLLLLYSHFLVHADIKSVTVEGEHYYSSTG